MRFCFLQVREVAVSVAVDGGGAAVCDLVTRSPATGLAEQQPEEIWRAVLAAARSALDHSPAAESVDIVEDEIAGLRRMVHSFSQFAKVPEVRLETVELGRVLGEFERAYGEAR